MHNIVSSACVKIRFVASTLVITNFRTVLLNLTYQEHLRKMRLYALCYIELKLNCVVTRNNHLKVSKKMPVDSGKQTSYTTKLPKCLNVLDGYVTVFIVKR